MPWLIASIRRSISTKRPDKARFDQSAFAVVWTRTIQPRPRLPFAAVAPRHQRVDGALHVAGGEREAGHGAHRLGVLGIELEDASV